MSNLRENADRVIQDRQKWLNQVIKAKELLEQLPEEIIQLQGEADCYGDNTLFVRVWGKDSAKVLKANGVQGLRLIAFSKTYLKMEGGEAILPSGLKVSFEAGNIEPPPNCVIKEVTKPAYEVECLEGATA